MLSKLLPMTAWHPHLLGLFSFFLCFLASGELPLGRSEGVVGVPMETSPSPPPLQTRNVQTHE